MERFPDLGRRETRSLLVEPGQHLPGGEYGFIEFYCDEPGCDCRRVVINVMKPETGWGRSWAIINYGWESADFYRKWSHFECDPAEMRGPILDPFNPQSKYAEILLQLFRDILESPGYVERLKRHYQMFRGTVQTGRENMYANRAENRRKRLRDPKRPGAVCSLVWGWTSVKIESNPIAGRLR
jgi:hypothetical protein